MKLHLNATAGANTIHAYGEGYVLVNSLRIEHPVIVMVDRLIDPWPVSSGKRLTWNDFTPLIEFKPELVILGSGSAFRFPDAHIMAAFSAAKIGFEVMNTPAACRTYNILMSEGRNVATALLI